MNSSTKSVCVTTKLRAQVLADAIQRKYMVGIHTFPCNHLVTLSVASKDAELTNKACAYGQDLFRKAMHTK